MSSFVFVNKHEEPKKALETGLGTRMEINGQNISGVFEVGMLYHCRLYSVGKIVTASPASDGTYWGFAMSVADFEELRGLESIAGTFKVDPDTGYLRLVEDLKDADGETVVEKFRQNPDWFLESFRGCEEVVKLLEISS